ncbi:TetR/AcrR family transcriptional regulator [Kitasatospora camelliae]|uniref:Helix-turn-helix domain-containing protein n=1 Tax=Kitasatospora camelliae TaxID=3156397 RepID=A0AAU8K047_9ACTN
MTDQEFTVERLLPAVGQVPEQRMPFDPGVFAPEVPGVASFGAGSLGAGSLGAGSFGTGAPERGLPERGLSERAVPVRAQAGMERPSGGGRAAGARLRVDARRNLESVLKAARQVFGELGYDAPMEEVARRAGVGVGTVYRRFPSKEVLVQRIAAEEVAWLTARARDSLYGGDGPWEALSGFLARAVSSGAGRLLPPEAFRYAEEIGRVPEQRVAGNRVFETPGAEGEQSLDADPRLLLDLLAALVARAGAAGELRPGVTVSDVVLVLTAAVPVHAGAALTAGGRDARDGRDVRDARDRRESREARDVREVAEGDAPGDRLLRILLHGLRAR